MVANLQRKSEANVRNIIAILLLTFCFGLVANDSNASATFRIGPPTSATTGGTTTATALGTDLKSVQEVCGLGGGASGTSGGFALSPDEDLKFVSVAVPCFENLIFGIAKESIEGFTGFLSDVVAICLTLYLIFFGIKVSTGITNEQRLKGEVVVHALKITFVAWLVFYLGITNVFDITMNILNGFIKLVMAPVSVGECKITAPETMQVWLAMDCLFGKFIGWNTENGYGATWNNVPLLFGFVTHSASAGFGGLMIASIILMTVWSLLMAFFRVAFGYILAILAIVLLFTISPIMLPMMLFAPTKQFFDQWWKMIVSMILQPVIMFAFMAFSLSLMNEIILGEGGISDIFPEAKPGNENLTTKTQGDQNAIFQVFNMFSGDGSADSVAKRVEHDKEMIFSLISMLIVSYLLLSFANFASKMGHELSGTVLTPDVGSMGPKWMGGK